jgi:predicted RNA-binding Zn ribbon-like protein
MPTVSKEAPGELAAVRGFVNTVDIEAGTDELGSPADLASWLVGLGLASGGVVARDADLRRALALREALRELLLSNNDGRRVDPAAPAVLDEVASRAALRLRVAADGSATLVAEGAGVDAALGRLLLIVYRAMEAGTWPRLKACRNDTCRWAFYDHSKNRSGHWCTMAVCGNRRKAQAYRSRRRGEADGRGPGGPAGGALS